jgi:uncharacterized protein with PIN domain
MPAIISCNCPHCAHDLVPVLRQIIAKSPCTLYTVRVTCPECRRVWYVEIEWDLYVSGMKIKETDHA